MKCIQVLLILVGLINAGANAQTWESSYGTEFWAGFMQNRGLDLQSAEFQFFKITSDVNTTGGIAIPRMNYRQSFSVNAGSSTRIDVPTSLAMNILSEVVEDRGIYIYADDPVQVYAHNNDTVSYDAALILPANLLGYNYMITSYIGAGSQHPTEFLIVASTSNTEIEIIPSMTTDGGHIKDVPFQVTLNAGESYQVQGTSNWWDFTGTRIRVTDTSNCNKIAVFSGSVCSFIPTNYSACDHLYEQNIPLHSWGKEYQMPMFLSVFDPIHRFTYRVLAAENNTSVTINGGVPINLNAGEFYEENEVLQAICVSADKNISVVQFMESLVKPNFGGTAQDGDPAMLMVNHTGQWINKTTFDARDIPASEQHAVSIVVETVNTSLINMNGSPLSSGDFTPFPSCNNFSYARYALAEGDYTIESSAGFHAYAYGGSGDTARIPESYLYAAGTKVISTETPAFIYVGEDNTISAGESVQINAIGSQNVSWIPTDGLNCSNCLNPLASPTTTTTYIAAVSTLDGCYAMDSITITVEISNESVLDIPNLFSPNDDGLHDALEVFAENMQSFLLVIYNRWGEKVFETSDAMVFWDGKHNGKLVNTGVYAWTIQATDVNGKSIPRKGNITLVR